MQSKLKDNLYWLMGRNLCRHVIFPLLVILVCCCTRTLASDSADNGGMSSSLPSAPEPALHASAQQSVRHTAHVIVPMLDGEPKLSDFLVSPPSSQMARQMLRISHFVERYPDDGKPSTEPTIAYLGYTHKYFYAAFICHDKTPHQIRAHMLARDNLGDDDNVDLFLDTFHDQRRAFLFEANALGIQSDALYSEQNGSDYSFDTVWDTWGKRTP